MNNNVDTLTAERDFVLTRVLAASPARVYEAWTDPDRMAQWWGPKDFTNPVCVLDVRPGGDFRIVMRSPDGSEFPFKGTYREVLESARLVYTNDVSEHGEVWHAKVNKNRPNANGKNIRNIITTVTFDGQNGRTRMGILVSFDSAEDRDALVKIGMSEGWSQSFDRLETLLSKS